jgi:tetratricopeptide (TPR) repeat protein
MGPVAWIAAAVLTGAESGAAPPTAAPAERDEAALTARIDQNPADGQAWRLRGELRARLRRYTDALYDYSRAVRCDPNDAWAYFGRGCVRYELNHRDLADADFESAIRARPAMRRAVDDFRIIAAARRYFARMCP